MRVEIDSLLAGRSGRGRPSRKKPVHRLSSRLAPLRIRGFDAITASLPSIVIATRLAALLFAATVPLSAAERTPWTSSKLHGSPEPPAPYVVERAFPQLTFSEPIEAVMVPGTKRLPVAGVRGKLVPFPSADASGQT